MTMLDLPSEEFEALRAFIKKQCGIAVGDEKSYLIETRLSRLVTETGCDSFAAFHDMLVANPQGKLRDQIVDAMTTNETHWFRDGGPWAILNKALLEGFCSALQSGAKKKIRVWSAACSTGQEPYSIAMSILEHLRDKAPPGVKEESFEIIATDISPSALFISISGRYDRLSIHRGLDGAFRDRYFEASGNTWLLSDRVKKMVSFQKFNLMDSFVRFGELDLVMCRNVLIYFSHELKKDIVSRISESLVDDGSLIIGASESLQGALAGFVMNQCDGNFFYRAKPRERV
jgi:chemotaxis protein methyltransferase CheR